MGEGYLGGAGGEADGAAPAVKRGRLKQSVARWCFGSLPLPALCKAVKGMGVGAIDLLGEEDFGIVRDEGLACSLVRLKGTSLAEGLNHKPNHDGIVRLLEAGVPQVAKMGWPNVIAFFGNRRPGMSESEAFDDCVAGLSRVKALAEENKVTICVELLNSKVNHKGYQGDHTDFGLRVVKAVDSPHVRLLYDIYHMQIMEGDVIATIRAHAPWFAHYHTGGVPGRGELDEKQELNWRAIARTIVETGYQGYLAHEFVPTRDPLTSLREAVVLCDV